MNAPIDPRKFQNPTITAKGERRASVFFKELKTLWFNSGAILSAPIAILKAAPQPIILYI